ncbi:Rv3235 family protein [Nostocoides vanveenii]|uniref:Energy transducer TonB n=1 Tax=Nostocoides vanveenii TaxID=330835 RepID=A0ABN2L506_9MICO
MSAARAGAAVTRGAAADLPPIRVLPIPEHRPMALDPDEPVFVTWTGAIDHSQPFIQDALAFELMPRRSDVDREVAKVDLPDPHIWIRTTGQLLIEVMAGLRSPAQVVRACAPEVYDAIARRHAAMARRRPEGQGPSIRPRVARVRTSNPVPGAIEAALLIVHGARVRAMAVRVDATVTGWRVTALQLG